MKTNILGTEYEIFNKTIKEDAKLEDSYGYVERFSKKIVLDRDLGIDKNNSEKLEIFKEKVLLHEIIHCYLYESGLDNCTGWACNEEIVDWMALQMPKIMKTWEDVKREVNND